MTAIDQLNATPGERQVAAMAKALAKHEPDVCGTDSYEAVEVSGLSTGVAPAPMAITLRLGRDEFTEFAKQPAQRIIWRAVLHRTSATTSSSTRRVASGLGGRWRGRGLMPGRRGTSAPSGLPSTALPTTSPPRVRRSVRRCSSGRSSPIDSDMPPR